MTTDEIRGMLGLARALDNVKSGGGDGKRQEALTLAICMLLDSGLVLADPDEIKAEGDPDRFLGDRARRAIDSAEPVAPSGG